VPKERFQDPTLRQSKRGVWFFRAMVDRIRDGKVTRVKETFHIGVMGKREAEAKKREVMRTLNRAEYVITSQIPLNAFLEEYQGLHVDRLSASTRIKYETHLKNHIKPAFGHLMLCEVTPLLVQQWLDAKELSWATKTDLRNILSSVFTNAIKWGRWKDANPIEHVSAGRKRAAREKRKLSDEDTRRLLAALPEDVRLLCSVCLFLTLRISEALGLQEKHLDFSRGIIQIRQRFWRGDIDVPKNEKAVRDLPMAWLADELKKLCTGDPERFVFQISTHPNWKRDSYCRDDRDIQHYFLRPAAKALGIYWLGFGFHTLRREAITALGNLLGAGQVMHLAGHSTLDMTALYTLADRDRQEKAIREHQERLLGKPEGGIQ
jgi:integrase